MEINTIDAAQLSKAFLAGAKNLEANKERINELNVFPVPDGDTGTNMTMTIMAAAKEVAAVIDSDESDMRAVCKAISSGSLRGARGNSGVILSQLFRGFTKVIKKEESLNVDILCEATQRAVETAYKAVMQPKEGTILTVARAGADKALELCDTTDDILLFLEGIVKECNDVLQKTPDMLPVLKEAGVVDSGGEGLCKVLEGAYAFLSGKEIDLSIEKEEKKEEKQTSFTYQMEFSFFPSPKNTHEQRRELRQLMKAFGDGAYLEREGKLYIGRVATDDPGLLLAKAIKNGELIKILINNTRADQILSSAPKAEAPKPPVKSEPAKELGVVTVSIGEGMNRIFKELGADHIIEGGQTMNPSTEDIIDAIAKVNAKTVFVLPNNKNIILSANQAKDLVEDKTVVVLPTTTLPQGISALINFIPDQTAEENEERMLEELSFVKSGEVTYAVRDTTIDGKTIAKGDYMGIADGGILEVDKKIVTCVLAMLEKMIDEESALISMYYGTDVTEKEAKELVELIADAFPDVEVELQEGGQPVYYYVVSVE